MYNANNGGNWKKLQIEIKFAREQIRRNGKTLLKFMKGQNCTTTQNYSN